MRSRTVTVREGENVGPVDWAHDIAKDMPTIWREAERNPGGFTFSEHRRPIVCICMYDGWPYWTPRPAVCFVGPLNSAEWAFFDSYGVRQDSIQRAASAGEAGTATDSEAGVAEGEHATGIAGDAQTTSPLNTSGGGK